MNDPEMFEKLFVLTNSSEKESFDFSNEILSSYSCSSLPVEKTVDLFKFRLSNVNPEDRTLGAVEFIRILENSGESSIVLHILTVDKRLRYYFTDDECSKLLGVVFSSKDV